MSERRPWRRAAAWLAFLGPFFFASYGLANWLASRRSDVGSVVFGWERSIPFVPWSIVPYWSIDVLYALSPFVCRSRRELDRHAGRLLLIQLISVACFVAFPLRFTFERPDTGGFFGVLFTALGSFDKPFNQAPSLHIALLVAIWARFAAHLTGRFTRLLLHAWMALIAVSVLTTWQHHFIDLPTGLAVGFAALWVLPDEEPSPLKNSRIAADAARRRLALRYLAGAAGLAVLASIGGAWLWAFWPALSCAVVAANYAAIGARGFQKANSGGLSAGAWGLLGPYVLAAWVNSRLWTVRHPHPVEVAEGVWIGRIPGSLPPSTFTTIVDLAAELPCRPGRAIYRSFPSLDLIVPDGGVLAAAADEIEASRTRGPVLVCCALGYSRSAAAIVAWLLRTRRARDVEEASAIVRRVRPSVVLTDGHRLALEAMS